MSEIAQITSLAAPVVFTRQPAKPIVKWLRQTTTEKDLPTLQAFFNASGLTIVEHRLQLQERSVLVRPVVEQELIPLQNLAKTMKAKAWDFHTAWHWVKAEPDSAVRTPHRVQFIDIFRSPIDHLPDKAEVELWHEYLSVMPGGNMNWSVTRRPEGHVRLTFAEPPSLPSVVRTTLPPAYKPDYKPVFAIGTRSDGKTAGVDFIDAPHLYIVGATGAGKSVVGQQLAIQGLTHGLQIHIIDPVKQGADFLSFEPFAQSMALSFTSAAQQMRAALEEVDRRKHVLTSLGHSSWKAFKSSDDLIEYGMIPQLLLIDEVSSIGMISSKPKGVADDDPDEITRAIEAAAQGSIIAAMRRLAFQARFVGIFEVPITQRLDANVLGGDAREQFGHKIQLSNIVTAPSRIALNMALGEDLDLAAGRLFKHFLPETNTHGLGVIADATVHGGMVAFKPAFADVDARGPDRVPVITRELFEMGVPLSDTWLASQGKSRSDTDSSSGRDVLISRYAVRTKTRAEVDADYARAKRLRAGDIFTLGDMGETLSEEEVLSGMSTAFALDEDRRSGKADRREAREKEGLTPLARDAFAKESRHERMAEKGFEELIANQDKLLELRERLAKETPPSIDD